MAEEKSAKQFDIKIEQGSTFFLSISLENQEGYILNIKDCLGIMQIRDIKDDVSKLLMDVTPYLKFTYDNKILVEIPGEITKAIKWSTGLYDLKVKEKTSGRVYRLLEGNVTLDKQVTFNEWTNAAKYVEEKSCTEEDPIVDPTPDPGDI
jgi:hypothetical protein